MDRVFSHADAPQHLCSLPAMTAADMGLPTWDPPTPAGEAPGPTAIGFSNLSTDAPEPRDLANRVNRPRHGELRRPTLAGADRPGMAQTGQRP